MLHSTNEFIEHACTPNSTVCAADVPRSQIDLLNIHHYTSGAHNKLLTANVSCATERMEIHAENKRKECPAHNSDVCRNPTFVCGQPEYCMSINRLCFSRLHSPL